MDAGLLARSPIPRLRRRGGSKGASSGRPGAGSLGRARRVAQHAIANDRRLRLGLVGVLIAIVLCGAGWLWLRQSSFVSVEHVRVSGVHGPQARAIEEALREAAKGMSTMQVSNARLREAVARFPVVQEVRASGGFPHSLHIYVSEQQPVAALVVAGLKTAVAADGVVLGPDLLSGSLPTVTGSYEAARGQHLHNAALLESLTVLGAAPPLLAKLVSRVYEGPRGLTAAMKSGLLVYFGDASRPHAKWLSLARVLADESSAGALYVDVRLPGRPAAGMSSPTSETTSTQTTPSSSESTVAALAAGLTAGKSEPSKEPEEAQGATSGESQAAGESNEAASEASSTEGASQAPAGAPAGTAETGG
jgi:cell division septal protein FtsQ